MNIHIEKNVMVPMRDDVLLATDIYRPADSAAYPVLLVRLPYDKEPFGNAEVLRLVQAGYILVIQDCRGRFASQGQFDAIRQERDDGVDCASWVAQQPWCQSIGTYGASYLGSTQWLPAPQFPAAVKAMWSVVTPADIYEDLAHRGGTLLLGTMLFWCTAMAIGEQQRRLAQGVATPEDMGKTAAALGDMATLYQTTPLAHMPHLQGISPHLFNWVNHTENDDYWQSICPKAGYAQVTLPVFHVGGWYDLFLNGTLTAYREMRQRAGSAHARQHQKLIIGPWSHGNFSGSFPEMEFGMAASIDAQDLIGQQIRWFDRWLKDVPNGIDEGKPVRLFVMGANLWRDEDDWPLPDTQYRNCYLHSAGHANTLNGDGALSFESPQTESPDVYQSDPRNPVPTLGGATLMPGGNAVGPRDQRLVEGRADVLCYTTAALAEALEVTGPIEAWLYVASSAKDTDLHVKLIDVHPDGAAMLLTDGVVRMRYRQSTDAPTLLQPDTIERVRIDLWSTSNCFKTGHRIRVEIASSNFPRYDRNSQTGGNIPAEPEADYIVASNTIYHDADHPSHLVLPIIQRP